MARALLDAAPRIAAPIVVPFKWVAGTFFSLTIPTVNPTTGNRLSPTAPARVIRPTQIVFQNGSHAGDGITAGAISVQKNGSAVGGNALFSNSSAARRVIRYAPAALQTTYTSGDTLTLSVVTALGAGVDGVAYIYYTEEGAVGPRLIQLPAIPFSWASTTAMAVPLPSESHSYAVASFSVQNGSTAGTNGAVAGVTCVTPANTTLTANLTTNAPAYSVSNVNAAVADWFAPSNPSPFGSAYSTTSTITFTNTTAATAVDGYLTVQLWED